MRPSSMTRRDFVRTGLCGLGVAAVSVAGLGSAGLLGGCSSSGGLGGLLARTQTITDDVGREVTIPAASTLRKIYFTSPLAQIFCFTLAPDLLAGTSMSFTEEQLAFLPDGTEKLMNLGSLSGGGFIDVEILKYSGTQVVFSISGTDLTDVNISDALRLEQESGIPVVLIDGSMDRIAESYRLLGRCLGREERAEELARYCEDIYRRVTAAVSRVPESERVRYYFAEGSLGLQTEPDVSQHSLAFQAARGINVAADVDPAEEGRAAGVLDNRNMVNVDIGEICEWDPEVIVAWDYTTRKGSDEYIRVSPEWAGITAVREGHVYTMPNLPFAFCDRPPGANRFLGIQWLANLFYPGYYDVDMVEVVREFYSTCYWREITAAQARKVLGASYTG